MKYVREHIDVSGKTKYYVSIRKNRQSVCNNFSTLNGAEKFITQTLAKIDMGKVVQFDTKSFQELATIYLNNEVPKLAHEMNEIRHINKMILDFGKLKNVKFKIINDKIVYDPYYLSSMDIKDYRNEKLKNNKPSTVIKRLMRINQIYQYGIMEKEFKIDNPAKDIIMPKKGDDSRDRRPSFEELKLIYKYGSSELWASVKIAIRTCMRKGEWVDRDYRIEKKKKGFVLIKDQHKTVRFIGKRKIPLSRRAYTDLLRNDLLSYEALKSQWQRLMAKLNIIDLRFNDLRHEGISRLFERGIEDWDNRPTWSIPEVAKVSGHTKWDMLRRYTNLKEDVIAGKLN
jgi:hypothetical protein